MLQCAIHIAQYAIGFSLVDEIYHDKDAVGNPSRRKKSCHGTAQSRRWQALAFGVEQRFGGDKIKAARCSLAALIPHVLFARS